MNDDADGASAPRGWWLRSTLARLAFGASTRDLKVSTSTSRSLMAPASIAKPDLDDPAQREFGDYELLELIGQGGMGLVYRARQRSLNRDVAIKLLSAGQWASEEFVAGFRNEAQNAALLQHPNIVVVHEMGEHNGLVYYAMQLVRGCSLSQKLAGAGVPTPREAATVLRTVAEAVDYAHRLGVLHLDLKPGNILVNEHGEPLVADFGLARRLEQALDIDHVSGTPSYMAPEQAQVHGPALSPATDVWGLGAILYELLAGTPPFEAGDPEATLRLLLAGQLRKPSLLARMPPDLEAICLKCLEREPVQRYAGARALADDLGRFLEGRAVTARRLNAPQRIARWGRREPRLAIAGTLAVLALLAGVLATSLQWRRAEANATQARHSLATQRTLAMQQAYALGRDQDALPGLAANLAGSVATGDTAGEVRDRKRLGYSLAALPRLIDHFRLPQRLSSLALSPDGRHLAIGTLETSEVLLFDTRDGRRLWTASLAGEPAFFGRGNFEREMHQLRFSADGKYLVVGNWWPTPVVSPSGIDNWRIDVASGRVAHPQQVFPGLSDATYGADGRYALLRRLDSHEVQLWDATTWKPASAVARYSPLQPAWLIAPDAKFIASWTGQGVDVLDPRTLAVRHTIAMGPDPAPISAWATSPDAGWLALGDLRGAVVLVDPLTGTQKRLPPGPAVRINWLQFSADGAWLAAGSEEGSAWLWHREDGFSHGRAIRVDMPVRDVMPDHASGLVRVGGPDAVSVWQLSGLEDADRPALARAPLPRHAQQIPPHASDLHPASGLFATASIDGEVRLWRLPGTPLRQHAAAPQMTAQLDFDGVHLVAVDGNAATVVRAMDDQALSPPFAHPHPIGFAALTPDGATLVTSSGRELRVFDWRRRRLRFPPLLLPGSPMRLALDPAGHHLHASWTVDHGRALTEAVGAFSLDDGHALAAPVEFADGLTALAATADGTRLLLATGTTVELRDSRTLQPMGRRLRQHDANAIAANAVRIAIATSSPQAIRLYDVATSRWLPDVAMVEPPMAVAMSPDGALRVAFQPHNQMVRLMRDDGADHVVDAPEDTQFVRATAFSADGKVLAQALIDGVLLLDAMTGEWLAPPLRAAIPAPDLVAQLAFSPDGTRLLARTHFGRWLWWRLEPDTRPDAIIAHEAQLLSPTRGASITVQAPAAERRMLRQLDPGPASSAAPGFPADSCLAPMPPLLPRDPSTPAHLLDLASFATFNPRRHSLAPTTLAVANLCGLPLGRQRLDGVDFDLRVAIRTNPAQDKAIYERAPGGGQLPGITIAADIPIPPSVSGVAALELLATSTTFVQDPPPESLPAQADVVLHYSDRSSARVPLRYGRELMMWIERPPAASHVGWKLTLPRAETGLQIPPTVNVFRVRVPNPHPERTVHSVDIVANRVTWNGFTVFAMTVDPLPAPPREAASPR